MESISLTLSPRTVTGKNVKRLRRDGVIPVHLFGRGVESLALQVASSVLGRVLPQAGRNVPITVDVEGQKGENVCFVREVQRHPVTEALLHVDFLRVDVSQRVTAEVPVLLEGAAPAVENLEGTLLQTLNSVSVEALPMNMPASFVVDVSVLDDFDKTIRVATLQTDEDVAILNDAEEMIATVAPPRIEEEEVEDEVDEVEGEEGAEAETQETEPQA